jgi:HAE1 family hydrophobic/amphiphilic exporter-1/multidrug efflux pump
VRAQNSQFAGGRIGVEPIPEQVDFTYSVQAQGRLASPEEFEQIVVHTGENGSIVRLRDVARVELGAQNYNTSPKLNGQPTVPIAIFLQPGANALQTGGAIQKRMEELKADFPRGMAYTIPYDTLKYVKVSIEEVVKTLLEAMVLVFCVVLLFLQSWRATIIPMLAVPVSLIGTFAAMLLFGFSINILTLFGMVLAIGIVVDDAIVVLENVERIMTTENLPAPAGDREGDGGGDASGHRDRAGADGRVPAGRVPRRPRRRDVPAVRRDDRGLGRDLRLRRAHAHAPPCAPCCCSSTTPCRNRFLRRFNEWFARMTGRYEQGVTFVMKRTRIAVAVFAVMVLATVGLFRTVPTALAPVEDQGYVFVIGALQDAAALRRTVNAFDQVAGEVRQHPAVANAMSVAGMDPLTFSSKTNAGLIWVPLKPWDERTGDDKLSPAAVVGSVFAAGAKEKDAMFFAVQPPPIEGLSNVGGFEMYIQSRGRGTPQELAAAVQKVVAAASKRKELENVMSTYSANVPQMRIDLDREKAMTLGVPVPDVFDTLQSTFGALYVNDFNRSGRVYQVQLQSEPRFRAYPEDIRNVYVRAKSGELVPLTAIASIREVKGPETVERFNVFNSAKILGGAKKGYSSGDALKAMEEVAAQELPQGYAPAWTGTAYQEKVSGGASNGVYLLGVLMVFLILAAQFERWALPLAVILAVPFRGFRRVHGGLPARAGERHLLPDRHADADRPGGEERDPDRRVRDDEAPRGHAARAGRGRGRKAALPADHHDLAVPDLRRAAAGRQLGRRRHEPPFARHERDRRHARGHVHRDVLRAVVLPLDCRAAPQGRAARD